MISAADRARLHDMVAYAEHAIGFLGEADEAALEASAEKLFAVVRALEVVGEAASRLSAPVRDGAPQIAWQAIRGMRNQLIHAYPELDVRVIVDTVRRDLPQLIADVRALLRQGPP